jgi:hypothetical protein
MISDEFYLLFYEHLHFIYLFILGNEQVLLGFE